jgi:DNA-binding transcriptional regulator YbjK
MMEKSPMEDTRNKLVAIIDSLTTVEELNKMEIVLCFVLFASKKDQRLLDKLKKNESFNGKQMIAFMIEKLAGNKRALKGGYVG